MVTMALAMAPWIRCRKAYHEALGLRVLADDLVLTVVALHDLESQEVQGLHEEAVAATVAYLTRMGGQGLC